MWQCRQAMSQVEASSEINSPANESDATRPEPQIENHMDCYEYRTIYHF